MENVMTPWGVKSAVLREIAKNIAMSIPAIRKARAKGSRTALAPSAALLQRYAYDLVDQVIADAGTVEGADILEIGPGDNIITGLCFIALGAKSYTAMDRFPGDYTSDASRIWYKLLSDDFSRKFGKTWPTGLSDFPDDPRIQIVRHGVEIAKDIGKFDIICSYAVGEHVRDIQAFANVTARNLRPNGIASHGIDMGGHDWDRFGDPFLFLKFPDVIWHLMGSNRGTPNRKRHEDWLRAFRSARLAVTVAHQKVVSAPEGFDSTMGAVYRLHHATTKSA